MKKVGEQAGFELMGITEKIEILGQAAQFDLCGACGTEANRIRGEDKRWIYPAAAPDGRKVLLLKVLLTNACQNDCSYCVNRCGRDFPRTTFRPEELAKLFDDMHRRRLVQGLFLSSGVVGSADRTMERMLATVEIVRLKYRFPGYVHLKILPGASAGCIERATELASRVSVNLEAPSQERLSYIAGDKDFQKELLAPLKLAKSFAERKGTVRAGLTTQFVVGAAGESDGEILKTADQLYREIDLARVYFSAFQPVEDTPLEDHPPTPLIREHRLYQTDFLFRKYGFELEELVFDEAGNLPTAHDPKLTWALYHPERFPIEVNRASREQLLRIPGIGPRSSWRIVKCRREGKLRSLKDLKVLGSVAQRAAPFILLDGKRPPFQLGLWKGGEAMDTQGERALVGAVRR